MKEFKYMVEKNKNEIPTGICKGLSVDNFNKMIDVSIGIKPLCENIIIREKLRAWYEKL
ncbi:MAG: hypothetical protein ABIP79_00165 [Chitinophagaceae bacterium]